MISSNNRTYYGHCSVTVVTVPPQRISTRIYLKSIPYIIAFTSVQMGMLLELEFLEDIVQYPIPLVIGFFCQSCLMPMIAWVITKIFRYPPLFGLALFVVGCCPGGTVSNQLTFMFNGDLNLSVFMSLLSMVISFFLMPFWLYTLGTYAYVRHLKMFIPFPDLMQPLLTALVPMFIGMIIAYYLPSAKSLIKRMVKPILIALLVYFFGFGTYVNFYLLSYIDWRIALTAPCLPWFGYTIGATIAWILGEDWMQVKTIGIETGKDIYHIV